jgi:hypothetical protein
VLGCHIEMTGEPGRDYYYFGCGYQQEEPPLEMTVRQPLALRDAAVSVAAPRAHTASTTSSSTTGWDTDPDSAGPTRSAPPRMGDAIRYR